MVIAQPLVDVVGQAGVENGIQLHLAQGLDVAVAELGREAGRIAGDGRLTGQIEATAGHRAGVRPAKPSLVQNAYQNGSSS